MAVLKKLNSTEIKNHKVFTQVSKYWVYGIYNNTIIYTLTHE